MSVKVKQNIFALIENKLVFVIDIVLALPFGPDTNIAYLE